MERAPGGSRKLGTLHPVAQLPQLHARPHLRQARGRYFPVSLEDSGKFNTKD